MFLFNQERTGQIPYLIGELPAPEIVWDIKLPQYPNSGPESTAAFDDQGNIYFGCHNGSIYSINNEGKIRWQFITKGKVYSSPLVYDGRVYFCCNGADVICLSLSGELEWSFQGMKELKAFPRWKKAANHLMSYLIYDYHSKSIYPEKITAWCSPNLIENLGLVVNLYGIGVITLDLRTGRKIWQTSLGVPWNHLAGVAVFQEKGKSYVVAVAQSNRVCILDAMNGDVIWKRSLKFLANSWSNPSVDCVDRSIYCCTSRKSAWAWIYKFDYEGNLLWKRKLSGGVRGSINISKSDFILVPSLLGIIYKIDKIDGTIKGEFNVAVKNRGLWTSLCIDDNHNILVNAKKSYNKGALIKMNATDGKVVWELETGKALCVPVMDKQEYIYIGTWHNNFLKIKC